MEWELEPRVKPLAFKVKATSRETATQKAVHVIDTDLRTYWSSGTNTKEWILLELQEPCLLSHIRIHNKSVLEWEIMAGLQYKPETFVKIRSRCEAPRRDMVYSMNYTSCRYVRISCLRGNPIAIFFIQLIGISVCGLEPEFQPVVNYLLPKIVPPEQDSDGLHLQLLQDITSRLQGFLPQLEAELTKFADESDSRARFLAMLAGPFYPILHIVKERETARCSAGGADSEVPRNGQLSPALIVSSNFEPRRLRSSTFPSLTFQSVVFRPDAVFMLLRKAFTDDHLGALCKVASRVIHLIAETNSVREESSPCPEGTSPLPKEVSGENFCKHVALSDFSILFGDDFITPEVDWDSSYMNVLDVAAVEEGILHVMYACAAEPSLCSKLAANARDFGLALPLIQALLPALRPASCPLSVDDSFKQWMQPFVLQALSKIISSLSSTMCHPLLRGCAGYLSSFFPSHAKAACVLIDLCSSVLAPWMPQIVAKIDLTMELVEELLGVIQSDCRSPVQVRAALIYIVLAIAGYMDEVLTEYKEANLKVLFLVEMLEVFLKPVISVSQNLTAFSEMSYHLSNNYEDKCATTLHVIRAAVKKPSVLPSLESEWRRGSVPPSVLLSILDPDLPLPSDIDHCKSSFSTTGKDSANHSSSHTAGEGNLSNCIDQNGGDRVADFSGQVDIREEASLYFTPEEIRNITLVDMFGRNGKTVMQASSSAHKHENQAFPTNNCNLLANKTALLDTSFSMKYFSLSADYAQLLEYDDCQSRASEFRRLALDLDSKPNTNLEAHNAAIDALILSAECYINPFFMISVKEHSKVGKHVNIHRAYTPHDPEISELREVFSKGICNLKTISSLERRRDKAFVQILLEAAEMDRNFYRKVSDEGDCPYGTGPDEEMGNLLGNDAASDAITLVRRKQALLCKFIIQQLQRKQQSLHETLLHSLVFLLYSSTKLACSSEDVIDIIVGSAEHLNSSMTSMFHQYEDGVLQVNAEKLYRLQRRWMLLQSLVIASSGGSSGSGDVFNVTGFRYSNLIPPSAWIFKIAMFSSSAFPLVRFLGWMAISRNAEAYLNQGNFFTSKLAQLTQLLTIFVDDLAGMDVGIKASKKDHMKAEDIVRKPGLPKENFPHQQYQEYEDQSFSLSYPELSVFFPRMHKEFKAFRESILEAVGLQLKSFTSIALPDILSWLSELCLSPFQEKLETSHCSPPVKGYHARNARAVILFILEAVISEHMEALVPETPRLFQVLGSLCRSSYCDVSFLKCVLCLLKPIISYSLRKVSNEENHQTAEPSINFESVCVSEFFADLKKEQESLDFSTQRVNTALIIFVLASVFHDLSYERKREFIQSSIQWADFPVLGPTTVLQDYLFSFQQLLRSCNEFFAGILKLFGLVPMPQSGDVNIDALGSKGPESRTWFPDDFCYGRSVNIEKSDGDDSICSAVCAYNSQLPVEDMEALTQDIDGLLVKLSVAIESCWNLHPQLSESLAVCYAQCLMYSICVASAMPVSSQEACESDEASVSKSFDEFITHWEKGIEGLAENVSLVLANDCWEVASTMIDCILRVPTIFSLINVVGSLSSVMEKIIYAAPKMFWRLRADRWLSKLFSRGILVHESGIHLLELVSKMLNHPEPEQRFSALMRLGEPLGLNVDGGWAVLTSPSFEILASHNAAVSVSDSVLSHLVSNTWDQVALVAATDASLHLRTLAKALLVHYIPFASLGQLRAFLQTADTVFQGLGNIVNPNGEGLFSQLSLALLAGVCLYCPSEDMALLPQNVWAFVENLAEPKTGRDGEMDKRICQALCKVRDEQNDAKDALKEALSSRALRESDLEFGSTRESVLQVLANLTSAQSYFDLFAEKLDQEVTELEEAELELDILKNEGAQLGSCKMGIDLPFPSSSKEAHRLDQIKSDIQSLEKHRLREEIIARRQNKLLLRRRRQKYLEEATLRETELLQGLDRQKMLEKEKEIERQKSLELERARTNELRYNLELEKERQTQREIQRELEQVESGSRPQRREFSSTHASRPRDRYKDRDIGRTGSDSSSRASGPNMQSEMPVNPLLATAPTVLSGSRAFSGQPPTILQSRDRSDDCSSSYEENFDGSKDSGDTGSTGDPELVSGFDVLPGGYGTSQRHGSRGSKSRQILERRERDGRREGKWERKHS